MPGDTSRFDYESLDSDRHLLFITDLGASEVLAFDTQTRKVVARIKDVSEVHGVLAIPALHRMYASASGIANVFALREGHVTRSGGGFLGPNAHVVAVDAIARAGYFPIKSKYRHPVLRIVSLLE